MKKIFILLIILFYSLPVNADKLLKNGFINENLNYAKVQDIVDPKNTIILIYNHGQDKHDA